MTLSLLLLACAAANAQSFDFYLTGGLHSDKPTKATYDPPGQKETYVLQPYRSDGVYIGWGTAVEFRKDGFRPGIQLEIDYITYSMICLEYFTYGDVKQAGFGSVSNENTQYMRIAPSATLSRSFAGLKLALAIGPDYNIAMINTGGFIGAHAGIRVGYRGFMANAGYAMGFGSIPMKAYFSQYSSIKTRAFNVGLSLHPLAMFQK